MVAVPAHIRVAVLVHVVALHVIVALEAEVIAAAVHAHVPVHTINLRGRKKIYQKMERKMHLCVVLDGSGFKDQKILKKIGIRGF